MRAMLTLFGVLTAASPAFAQSLPPRPAPASPQSAEERASLEEATTRGRLLTIELDTPGEPLVGHIRALDDDAIEMMLESGIRRIPWARVARISHEGDSVGNGAVIGMAALGGWCAYICGQGLTSGGQTILAVLLNGAIGAGIGALIDHAHTGTTTVYRRRVAVRISPAVSSRSAAFSASMRW